MTAQPGEIRIGDGAERLLDMRIEPLKPAPELTDLARMHSVTVAAAKSAVAEERRRAG